MTSIVQNQSTEISILASTLSSTLDETLFFKELAKFIGRDISASSSMVFHILDDDSGRLVYRSDRGIKATKNVAKGVGVVGQVVKTKRAYFSNNPSRDPLFAHRADPQVKGELIVPVLHEGVSVATLHFILKDSSRRGEFSLEDVTKVVSILKQLAVPIANMKLFLAAKQLNETLLKRIEEQDKKIKGQVEASTDILSTHRIDPQEIIGLSQEILEAKKMADQVAHSAVNIVISGGPGSGKELLAQRIHCNSVRADGPFLVVDCLSNSEESLERELFGEQWIDSAGRVQVRPGALEIATNGTLLLKELSSLSERLQGRLAQLLNDGRTSRMDGVSGFTSKVRIISTSTVSMEDEVEKGLFREDLFLQVGQVAFIVPSLKERRDDIELIANTILNRNKDSGECRMFSPDAIAHLQEYSWPGNIRELTSVVQRADALCEGSVIDLNHLPEPISTGEEVLSDEDEQQEDMSGFAEMTLDELERHHICMSLERMAGNKTKTAKGLGITVKTLYNKLHSYGMIAAKQA
jgi:Nif-specific regulatory protein